MGRNAFQSSIAVIIRTVSQIIGHALLQVYGPRESYNPRVQKGYFGNTLSPHAFCVVSSGSAGPSNYRIKGSKHDNTVLDGESDRVGGALAFATFYPNIVFVFG